MEAKFSNRVKEVISLSGKKRYALATITLARSTWY